LLATRNFNVWLLSLAQGFHVAAAMTAVAVSSLVGAQIAPDASMATLPNAMLTVGVALSTIPLSYFMKRFSRKAGFFLGAFFGLLSFTAGTVAIYAGWFWLLCAASLLQGVYQASVLYYRFAAAESVGEERQRGIAISLVQAGSILAVIAAPAGVKAMNIALLPTEYAGAYVFMFLVALLAFVPLAFLRLPPPIEEGIEGIERPLVHILRQPKTLTALTANIAAWASMVLLMSATPLSMKHSGHGFDVSTGVIQLHVLGMYVPSLFSGFLIARFGVMKILFAGMAFLGLTIWSASLGHGVHHYSAALLALGISWNFLFIGGSTLLTETYHDAERAKVQGINEFTGFTVSALAAGSAGVLLVTFGWQSLLLVNLAILALVFVISLWYVVSERGRQKLSVMETND